MILYIAYSVCLFSSIAYTFATVFSKRSLLGGVGLLRTIFVTNVFSFSIQGLIVLFSGESIPSLNSMVIPLISGVFFFFGQILNLISLKYGDVTIQVPLLGIKVVFVAIFLAIFTSKGVSIEVVIASILCTLAVFILGMSSIKFSKAMLYTILFSICTQAMFAGCDCLLQKRSENIGVMWFLFSINISVMILSLFMIPFFKQSLFSIPKKILPWTLLGSFLMSIQAILLGAMMGIFRIVAEGNIIYSTRGLWSILFVGLLGKYIGIADDNVSGKLLIKRSIGATLLLLAVVIVILF